jgi:hypothetical protein
MRRLLNDPSGRLAPMQDPQATKLLDETFGKM